MHETGRVRFSVKEGINITYIAVQADLRSFKGKLVSLELRNNTFEEANLVADFLNEHIGVMAIQDING